MNKFVYTGAALILMTGIASAQTTSSIGTQSDAALNNPTSAATGPDVGQQTVIHRDPAANNSASRQGHVIVGSTSVNGVTGVVPKPQAGSVPDHGSKG